MVREDVFPACAIVLDLVDVLIHLSGDQLFISNSP